MKTILIKPSSGVNNSGLSLLSVLQSSGVKYIGKLNVEEAIKKAKIKKG